MVHSNTDEVHNNARMLHKHKSESIIKGDEKNGNNNTKALSFSRGYHTVN